MSVYELSRIANALERQNEFYKKYSEDHLRFMENQAKNNTTHEVLMSTITSLNERLVQMSATIEEQQRIINSQDAEISSLRKII